MADIAPRQLLNCGWLKFNYQPHLSVKYPSSLPIILRIENMYTTVSYKFSHDIQNYF